MPLRDIAWWRARLDIDRETSETDFHAICPVHGGASLHVTEKNGKVLINCFGEGCAYAGHPRSRLRRHSGHSDARHRAQRSNDPPGVFADRRARL